MLVLVRHGSTEWSETGKHTGTTDVPLSETGRRQAATLRPRLAGREFTLVLVSPLSRARETCELAGLGADAQVEPDLRELDYGAYEGLTTDQIRAQRPTWNLWRDGSPGGETPDEAGTRADRVIERLRAAGGDVLLFGHGHFSRVLGARALGLPASEGRLLMLGPASISVIGSEHDRPAIRTWNWTPTVS